MQKKIFCRGRVVPDFPVDCHIYKQTYPRFSIVLSLRVSHSLANNMSNPIGTKCTCLTTPITVPGWEQAILLPEEGVVYDLVVNSTRTSELGSLKVSPINASSLLPHK